MRVPLTILVGFGVVILAGCGNSRTSVTGQTQAAAPGGFRTLTLNRAGLRIDAPRAWNIAAQSAPLVVTFNSGTAVVALWRFERPVAAPGGGRSLARARTALIGAIQARDPTVRVLGSSFGRVSGARTIELEALQQIGGRTRRVDSTHVYVRGAEIVLDQYAPPDQFDAVDNAVFAPVRRSLALLAAGPA